ncbi:hypothetical protein [Flavicella sp.]|uniref:hypothetical protein n=1 Tax=Flavicella sp. TaxID=2957742 RepID=UPI00301919E6
MNTNPTTLHLVSFDVPYPPNYGGVIDVFYKIKHLYQLGVKIILHCYQYGRPQRRELDKYCIEVHYYPRKNNLQNLISQKPYIVKSRSSDTLINTLLKDNHPILFEGLHTTFPITLKQFENRKTLVRAHNIEHLYYQGLKKSTRKTRNKVFYQIESKKLKKYENILNNVDHILTISPFEHDYFKKKYGDKAIYVPVFYNQLQQEIDHHKKIFSLWHGDLRVVDNQRSLDFIIDVYRELNTELIIASNHITKQLIKKINLLKNISIVTTKKQIELENLIKEAHIHPLISFQKTGIKLRLLNILTHGKHLVANNLITEDTGLESCVYKANTISEFRSKINELLLKKFDVREREKRNLALSHFSPNQSAMKIVNLLK